MKNLNNLNYKFDDKTKGIYKACFFCLENNMEQVVREIKEWKISAQNGDEFCSGYVGILMMFRDKEISKSIINKTIKMVNDVVEVYSK